MKLSWKTGSIYVAFIILLLIGSAVIWRIYKERAIEVRLVQEANALHLNAQKGDAAAQFNLGQTYYHGEGIPQDYAQAANWYYKAASQGHPQAEYGLGYMYQYGQGLSQDYAEAARWYRKAAYQEYSKAEVNLATLYYYGWGVSQDYVEAASWYRKAADQGDANGEDGLGLMYYQGRGIKQDYAEASRWYRKSAEQGNAKGQYDLGVMYYHGLGVPRDPTEGRLWMRKAAIQGDEHAREALGMKLTPWLTVFLAAQALVGFVLVSRPLSFNLWERNEGMHEAHDWLSVGTGAFFLMTAGLGWYGYTHNLIWCLIYGVTGFALLRWSLNAIALVLLCFVFFGSKPSAPEEIQEEL
jgi:TPR repeat protein